MRLISRYADVAAMLQSPRLSANRLDQVLQLRQDGDDPKVVRLFETIKRQMLFWIPRTTPGSVRLPRRRLVPRASSTCARPIQRIVDRLLDAGASRGHMDLIADLGLPLPMEVIAEMLGAPNEDCSRLRRWSEDYAAFLGGMVALNHEQVLAIAESMDEFMSYFRELSRSASGTRARI